MTLEERRTIAPPAASPIDYSHADFSSGWEARAVQRWMAANLNSVPSHLLPAVTAIFPTFVHQAMLPPPEVHAREEGVSELRLLERARAKVGRLLDSLSRPPPTRQRDLFPVVFGAARALSRIFSSFPSPSAPATRLLCFASAVSPCPTARPSPPLALPTFAQPFAPATPRPNPTLAHRRPSICPPVARGPGQGPQERGR